MLRDEEGGGVPREMVSMAREHVKTRIFLISDILSAYAPLVSAVDFLCYNGIIRVRWKEMEESKRRTLLLVWRGECVMFEVSDDAFLATFLTTSNTCGGPTVHTGTKRIFMNSTAASGRLTRARSCEAHVFEARTLQRRCE